MRFKTDFYKRQRLRQFAFLVAGLLALLVTSTNAVAREAQSNAYGLLLGAEATVTASGLGLNVNLPVDITLGPIGEVSGGPTSDPYDLGNDQINVNVGVGTLLRADVEADLIAGRTEHVPLDDRVRSEAEVVGLGVGVGLNFSSIPLIGTTLNTLIPTLVEVSDATLDSSAQVEGVCGAFDAEGDASIESLGLQILGQTIDVSALVGVALDPNTEVLGIDVLAGLNIAGLDLNNSSVTVRLVANEQDETSPDPTSIEVNGLHLEVDLDLRLTVLLASVRIQATVDLIIAHSQAAFQGCNDVDLAVVKTTNLSGTPGQATVGVPFDYTVAITNNSAVPASVVRFTDDLPTEVSFLSFVSVSAGGQCDHDAGQISCTWASVPAGGSVSARYRVNPTTATAPDVATNAVQVTTADNNTGDDETSVDVEIGSSADDPTDLAVAFVGGTPADGQVGASQTVQIQYSNLSSVPAANSELIYTIAPGGTITGVSGPGSGTCSIAGNELTCGPQNVPAGFTGTLLVDITPTVAGSNTHTVNVSSTTPDSDLSNNTAQATVQVTAAVSDVILQATVSDDPDPGTEGEPVTYTIDVTNIGTATANGVTLNVALGPIPVTIQSVDPAADCTIDGNQVQCDLGDLAGAGGTRQVVIVAIPNGTGTLNLTGTAQDTDSNSAPVQESTVINAAQADLSITKTTDDTQVLVGERIEYQITVSNLGPNMATDVVVTDPLSNRVEFVSATPDQGNCFLSGSTVVCELGDIAANAAVGIALVVEAVKVGNVENIASVIAATDDPNPDNNDTDPVSTWVGISAQPIPTLSVYGLMLLTALFLLLASRSGRFARRR